MSATTGIEWTDATWNPVTGCTQVSPGCDNCYALTLAERFRGTPGHYFEQGFDVVLRPDKLRLPFTWRKPRKVFVNSMSDLFHKDIPDEYIARVFAVMASTPRHTYQVLTKRHGRMRSLLNSDAFRRQVQRLIPHAGGDEYIDRHWKAWPLPNVWLGVSVEDQKRADLRIPALLMTPAAVRFLSCEPLLGPVDVTQWLHDSDCFITTEDVCTCSEPREVSVDWVIAGGESGRGARPMHPEWVRSLRDQCANAGTAFHFKQWGGRTPKLNGRELDGRTHDEFPEVAA